MLLDQPTHFMPLASQAQGVDTSCPISRPPWEDSHLGELWACSHCSVADGVGPGAALRAGCAC